MQVHSKQDFVVTGFSGGYSSNRERFDFIVSALNKNEAKLIVREAKGLKNLFARCVDEFKSLNVYEVFKPLKI